MASVHREYEGNDEREEKEHHHKIDVNIYATRKTVAQGMMDIALLTANASQLKYVINTADEHEYFTITLILITASIVLQIVVGILLVIIGRWNINRRKDHKKCETINNIVVILIFLITVVNVLVSAFGPVEPAKQEPIKDSGWMVNHVEKRSLKGFFNSSAENF